MTWGLCIHNTYGSKAGDLSTLDGPSVDCHFHVARDGEVTQFLDTASSSWTARATANNTCVHIELEGRRDVPLTRQQFDALVPLARWIIDLYDIPLRKVDPTSASDPESWRGLFDHRDLAGIDHNDHSDGLPTSTPWPWFIEAIKGYTPGAPKLTLYQRLRKGGIGHRSALVILEAVKEYAKK